MGPALPRRRILIDANLMLFWLGGQCRPPRVGSRGPRAARHLPPDRLKGLLRFEAAFAEHVTLPHLLAEVSNLLTRDGSAVRGELLTVLQRLLRGRVREEPAASREASDEAPHLLAELGLTDTLVLARAAGIVVLTEDGRLRSELGARSVLSLSLEDAVAADAGRT